MPHYSKEQQQILDEALAGKPRPTAPPRRGHAKAAPGSSEVRSASRGSAVNAKKRAEK